MWRFELNFCCMRRLGARAHVARLSFAPAAEITLPQLLTQAGFGHGTGLSRRRLRLPRTPLTPWTAHSQPSPQCSHDASCDPHVLLSPTDSAPWPVSALLRRACRARSR